MSVLTIEDCFFGVYALKNWFDALGYDGGGSMCRVVVILFTVGEVCMMYGDGEPA